jgi:hypothetical protein
MIYTQPQSRMVGGINKFESQPDAEAKLLTLLRHDAVIWKARNGGLNNAAVDDDDDDILSADEVEGPAQEVMLTPCPKCGGVLFYGGRHRQCVRCEAKRAKVKEQYEADSVETYAAELLQIVDHVDADGHKIGLSLDDIVARCRKRIITAKGPHFGKRCRMTKRTLHDVIADQNRRGVVMPHRPRRKSRVKMPKGIRAPSMVAPIRAALFANPLRTNKTIAHALGVHPDTVAQVRLRGGFAPSPRGRLVLGTMRGAEGGDRLKVEPSGTANDNQQSTRRCTEAA